jgi:hypothetical protein
MKQARGFDEAGEWEVVPSCARFCAPRQPGGCCRVYALEAFLDFEAFRKYAIESSAR